MRFTQLFIGICFFLTACNNKVPQLKLLEVKELPSYPSGSTVVYKHGRFMVMGDDAPGLLILDSAWNIADTINLVPFEGVRVPKKEKPDLEAGTWFKDKNEEGLLLLGSGSLPPHRGTGWIIHPVDKSKRTFRLDTFYHRLQQAGITELNVEGLAQLPGWYVLACRGNMNYRKNHLVFVKNRFWNNQADTEFRLSFLGGNDEGRPFTGVSGLDYSYISDQLFLTASTEHTGSVAGDGAIGKSYLWVIRSMNRMVNYEAVNPFEIIDLEQADSRFKGAKIESVAIVSENKLQTELALVADNDNGKTTMYRVIVNHKKVEQPR